MKEWQEMGVMNFEMESATLLTMCDSQGLRAGWLRALSLTAPSRKFLMKRR